MKKVFVIMLSFVMMMNVFCFMNKAEAVELEVRSGIVTSKSVSVRKDNNTKAERYKSLQNGDVLNIVGEKGDWYIIDLASIGVQAEQGQYGYALKQFILADAYYVVLEKGVYLYATPWGNGVANGEKVAGTKLLVLAETADWLCVQTCDGTPGSSFIKKMDLNGMQNTQSSGSTVKRGDLCVVFANTLAIRLNPDDNEEAVGFIDNGALVNVIQWGDYFTSIEYELAGQLVEGWVHTKYLKKVLQ